MKWSSEEALRLSELVGEYQSSDKIISWAKISETLNSEFNTDRSKDSCRVYYQNYILGKRTKEKKQKAVAVKKETPAEQKEMNDSKTLAFNNGKWTSDGLIELNEEHDKNPYYILLAHGFDPDKWNLLKVKNSKWNQHNKQDGTVTLYSSRIEVEPLTEELTPDKTIETLVSDVKPYVFSKNRNVSAVRNLVIPLPDLHFPLLTMKGAETYLKDVKDIVKKGYHTIVIEMLGDTFHSNAMKTSQTVKGTILQDVDMVQAIETAKTFFDVLFINSLENAKEVKLEFASGNHSDFEYLFCEYLKVKYPQAEVNHHNDIRHAYKIGNVGIMITHGNYAKRNDYPILFANEFVDVWGSCKWREIHSGHLHKLDEKLVANDKGVLSRQFGTIKPTDQYETENGYTMTNQTTQVLEYSLDKLKCTYDVG